MKIDHMNENRMKKTPVKVIKRKNSQSRLRKQAKTRKSLVQLGDRPGTTLNIFCHQHLRHVAHFQIFSMNKQQKKNSRDETKDIGRRPLSQGQEMQQMNICKRRKKTMQEKKKTTTMVKAVLRAEDVVPRDTIPNEESTLRGLLA